MSVAPPRTPENIHVPRLVSRRVRWAPRCLLVGAERTNRRGVTSGYSKGTDAARLSDDARVHHILRATRDGRRNHPISAAILPKSHEASLTPPMSMISMRGARIDVRIGGFSAEQ